MVGSSGTVGSYGGSYGVGGPGVGHLGKAPLSGLDTNPDGTKDEIHEYN